MRIRNIKIRPVVLVIAIGLVTAINGLIFTQTLDATLVGVIGTLTTGLVGISSKLIESEEQPNK